MIPIAIGSTAGRRISHRDPIPSRFIGCAMGPNRFSDVRGHRSRGQPSGYVILRAFGWDDRLARHGAVGVIAATRPARRERLPPRSEHRWCARATDG